MNKLNNVPREPGTAMQTPVISTTADMSSAGIPDFLRENMSSASRQPDFARNEAAAEMNEMDSDMMTYNDFVRQNAKDTDRVYMKAAGVPQELYVRLGSRSAVDLPCANNDLKRGFSQVSLMCFSTTIMCTWEAVLFSGGTSLKNGGPAGLLYGFLFSFLGAFLTTMSLAELASMAPISSGQHYWVWLLCPEGSSWQRPLSWITGCLCFCGWQATVASGIYVFNTIVRGLAVMDSAHWSGSRWKTLLEYGFPVLIAGGLVNMFCARQLSRIEGFVFMLHICGFFSVLIPLLHLGPRSPTGFVFTQLSVNTGWEVNPGVAWCVGLLGTVFPFLGMDGPIHMAEEVSHASTNVPRAMVAGILLNGLMGLGMVLSWLYSMGNLVDALEHRSGYPFIYSFLFGTGTAGMTKGMTAIILVLISCAILSSIAAASRQTFTLARDHMIPAAATLKKICKINAAPLAATALTMIISASLSLIQLASVAAFQSVVSLAVTGLFLSYTIPISLMLLKRCRNPAAIKYGPWKMRPLTGILCNSGAIFYTLWVVVWSFFPPDIPVRRNNMNWSPVVLASTIILGFAYYALVAHKKFVGPSRQLLEGRAVKRRQKSIKMARLRSGDGGFGSASTLKAAIAKRKWVRKNASSSNAYSLEASSGAPSPSRRMRKMSRSTASTGSPQKRSPPASTKSPMFSQKPFMPEMNEAEDRDA